jgi:hypothetical protein
LAAPLQISPKVSPDTVGASRYSIYGNGRHDGTKPAGIVKSPIETFDIRSTMVGTPRPSRSQSSRPGSTPATGDGDQMDHRIGRAADGAVDANGILEG